MSCFRFGPFELDPGDRQLRRDGAPVELNARYLDALTLMVRDAGKLVSKDRFLDEVWRGVPVTDEALTQCIRTLRRQLGDDAGAPRFIETVPKHGYRFVAPVEASEVVAAPAPTEPKSPQPWQRLLLIGGAGTVGGGIAGIIGGLIYGFAIGGQPIPTGAGAASVLVVLVCLTVAVGLVGAAGVAFGIAAATVNTRRFGPMSILGAAVGGLIVGAVVKLLGVDAFHLLFGGAPSDITGAAEGALLGAGIGIGIWIADRPARPSLRLGTIIGALAGAASGALVALLGGRLMGGSLDLLARAFPTSRLRLDGMGAWFGEESFGPVTRTVTSALEGALFTACVVAALLVATRGRTR